MTKKTAFILIIALITGGLVAFWQLGMDKSVTTTSPHIGKVVHAVYATGVVEPTIMVPIAPRSSGYIQNIDVAEGDTVTKGTVLAQLDDSEQKAAIADLEARLTFAKTSLNRKEQLFKAKSIARDALDSARSDVASLKAQLDKAAAQAGYLSLIAPADGLIIQRDGEVGQLINAGQAVFYLSCCAPLRITAEVDEEDIPQVKIGQDVLIQSDAFPNKIYHGRVSAITPKGDNISRSYRVRIAFNDADQPFMIGMTVETNIMIEQVDDALLVPIEAVNNGKSVQILKDDIVQSAPVETGLQDANSIQITSGVSSSDILVSPYQKNLKDGTRVRPKEEKKAEQKEAK